MTGIMESYRRVVRGVYPAAKLCVVKDYPRIGDRSYRVMDGSRPIGCPETDPTTAWREAEGIIADIPSRRVMEMARNAPVSETDYAEMVDAWIAAKSDASPVGDSR